MVGLSKNVEGAKEYNKEIVLNMLQAQTEVSNKEFTKAGIGRFGASISELRLEGYEIDKTFVPDYDGVVLYKLIGKGEPIEKTSAVDKFKAVLGKLGHSVVAEHLEDILKEAQVTMRNKPQF